MSVKRLIFNIGAGILSGGFVSTFLSKVIKTTTNNINNNGVINVYMDKRELPKEIKINYAISPNCKCGPNRVAVNIVEEKR
jgi:hypothetical protein